MGAYSIFSILRNALNGQQGWQPAWRKAEPKKSYDAIVIGGGGPSGSASGSVGVASGSSSSGSGSAGATRSSSAIALRTERMMSSCI